MNSISMSAQNGSFHHLKKNNVLLKVRNGVSSPALKQVECALMKDFGAMFILKDLH